MTRRRMTRDHLNNMARVSVKTACQSLIRARLAMAYRHLAGLIGLMLLLGLPIPVSAQSAGLAWDALHTEEQRVLEPFRSEWESLPRERQERLRKGARR